MTDPDCGIWNGGRAGLWWGVIVIMDVSSSLIISVTFKTQDVCREPTSRGDGLAHRELAWVKSRQVTDGEVLLPVVLSPGDVDSVSLRA